jgi:hypothetical protein
MGRIAVELLSRQIEGEGQVPPEDLLLPTKLIPRESVRDPRRRRRRPGGRATAHLRQDARTTFDLSRERCVQKLRSHSGSPKKYLTIRGESCIVLIKEIGV